MSVPSDFLVVGGGSAGCVVTRVLAEAGYRVRLVELPAHGGPRRRPAEYLQAFNTAEDWGLRTVPQAELAGRALHWPRGRGPGGSSRINAMIWYPPREGDLQSLQAHGGPDWSPALLRQSLQVVTQWVRPQRPAWLSTAAEHFLRSEQAAVEPPQAFLRMCDRRGRRTAADILAESPATASRVQWLAARTDRLLFEGDRAVGIETAGSGRGGERWFASRGVILCGGTIASPTLLMRSGIGPADVLQQAGVPLRVAAAEVGRQLSDHLIMPVVFARAARDRFPTRFSPADLARWEIAGTGPVASNLAEAGAIYRLNTAATGDGAIGDDTAAGGEVQVHVTPTHYLLHPGEKSPAAMTLGVNLCRPASRGTVTLESADPAAAPRIDPAYLSAPEDLQALAAAVELAREVASGPVLRRVVGQELLPGAARRSAEATVKVIRRFAQTLYHPIGTCRLGQDPQSVVDPRCQVRGCENLYVIDAAVLPEIPSVNTNASVVMLAHHAALRLALNGFSEG